MALVGEPCRKLNIRRNPLPELAICRPRFLPSSSIIAETTNTNSNFSSSTISDSDLERLQVLGHGNSGTVYQVRHKITSTLYALKLVHGGDSEPTLRRQLLREMDILRRTDSPHVVRCHAVFEKPSGDVGFLMEYMDMGTLQSLLKTHGTLSESKIANVARHVTNGLNYLHSHKIFHRDIKPANLLVNSNMDVKIADFGASKIVGPTLHACNSFVGTCAYMSPERLDQERYGGTYDGYAGDIWSFGLTMMELYMGRFPLLSAGQRPDLATLLCAICLGEPPALPQGASVEFQSFLECCLQKDPTKRWTASQLLTHPFLSMDSKPEP